MAIKRIAIIGAGLSGLTAARKLQEGSLDVRVFEKSSDCGGRMSTLNSSNFSFDFGASFFTAKNQSFQEVVNDWSSRGLAALWDREFAIIGKRNTIFEKEKVARYVGTPAMSSIINFLSKGISVALEKEIVSIERWDNVWKLKSQEGPLEEEFDAVLMAVPPAQAISILGQNRDQFSELQELKMLPCWVIMAAFNNRLDLPYDAAFVHDSKLSFIARHSSKPGREDSENWILHGSPEWTLGHFDLDPKLVSDHLVRTVFKETGLPYQTPSWSRAHRWRYALAANPLSQEFFWSRENQLGICGDWCNGSRVEDAYLSGRGLAEKILEEL